MVYIFFHKREEYECFFIHTINFRWTGWQQQQQPFLSVEEAHVGENMYHHFCRGVHQANCLAHCSNTSSNPNG